MSSNGYRTVDASEIPDLHPVAELRDGWAALADKGGVVTWTRFDPLDFPQVLPWVLLLRQEDPADPARLRYLICGDGCRQTFGFTYQGKLFGENLPAGAVARLLGDFEAVRGGRGPQYSASPLPVFEREFIDVYRGVFGFSGDHGVVDRYMIVLAPQNVRVTSSGANAKRNQARGTPGLGTRSRTP